LKHVGDTARGDYEYEKKVSKRDTQRETRKTRAHLVTGLTATGLELAGAPNALICVLPCSDLTACHTFLQREENGGGKVVALVGGCLGQLETADTPSARGKW